MFSELTPKELRTKIAERSEALTELIDMVQDRSEEDTLKLLTVLHEVAKLHIAGRTPSPDGMFISDISQGFLFKDRHIKGNMDLMKATGVINELDEDGIPIGVPVIVASDFVRSY